MAKIIDGKTISAEVRAEIKAEVARFSVEGISVCLAVVIVGDDPASQVYVNNKEKACAEVGFFSEKFALPESTTQQELNALVKELNEKKKINGINIRNM